MMHDVIDPHYRESVNSSEIRQSRTLQKASIVSEQCSGQSYGCEFGDIAEIH